MKSIRISLVPLLALVFAPLIVLPAGCRKAESTANPADGSLLKIPFQTDWYPQAEHGGFYQALAKGYYKEAGIDVDVLPGGAGVRPQKNAVGFSMGRADDVIFSINQGLPMVIVGAFMQHDVHALMLHEENPINTFKELDGKAVMATPGSVMLQYLENHYGIRINVIPLNYGLAQFMADKNFIQQCFVTSEPFFVRKAGAKTKTMMISAAGYENYRVMVTSKKFARENPAAVRAFVAASIKGWEDFITGDPSPAKALIAAGNPQATDDLMDYSIQAMRDLRIITGYADQGERTGLMTRKRMETQLQTMKQLKIVREDLSLDAVVDFSFLPAELQPLVNN